MRLIVADTREIEYTKKGIGSSYLFRLDGTHVIDATKHGNSGTITLVHDEILTFPKRDLSIIVVYQIAMPKLSMDQMVGKRSLYIQKLT